MQLNEILEENSIKTISKKTKILESNLESLLSGKFEALQKTKALGFIAIIEREYHADLSKMREEVLEYYSLHKDSSMYRTKHYYLDEEKKGKSTLLVLVVLGLLIYASWYFLTQFDKKNLSGLIPFIDEEKIENFMNGEEIASVETAADLSIAKVIVEDNNIVSVSTGVQEEEIPSQDVSALVASLVDESTEVEVANSLESISIVPVNRLWFGLVNIESKEREHFSIDNNAYIVDVENKSWLVATSSAPFSLVQGDKTQEFNDAKEHYFKIDKNGIVILSKSEYIDLGGWKQW